MSLGKVDNVDVIANARTVRRFVIRSENFHGGLFTQRDLENVRNEMRFHAMIFTEPFRSAGGVEITQRNKR